MAETFSSNHAFGSCVLADFGTKVLEAEKGICRRRPFHLHLFDSWLQSHANLFL